MTTTGLVQEAVKPSMDLVTLPGGGYVHLLSLDAHSNQDAQGWRQGLLTAAHPYSFERWIRLSFTISAGAHVDGQRFWAPMLVVPDGWAVKFGTASTYQAPTDAASSIATADLPTVQPGAGNLGASGMTGPGTYTSPWIVLQAHIVDFSAVQPGSMLGSTGSEVVTPNLLHYNFAWNES